MKGSYQIRVNGEDWRVEGESIHTTLLDYLRRRGLTGAKEACDEGGCGACTVVMLDRNGEGEGAFRSICSCVTPLATAAGREILTIEGLCDRDQLHPVQRALAESLASPCGYCVPGVAMTLFDGYYRGDIAEPGESAVEDQLAGCLCRCGAYRGILEAGETCLREGSERRAEEDRREKERGAPGPPRGDRFAKMLAKTPPEIVECAYVDSDDSRFYRPLTMTALLRMRAQYSDAQIVAGGVDLAMRHNGRSRCLVSIEAIPELNTLLKHEGCWEVGAAVSLTDVREKLAAEYPELDEVLSRLGSRQVRNRATIGGSLMRPSPGGEIATVLTALDASVRLVSSEGEREVKLEGFHSERGEPVLRKEELVKSVRIPRYGPAQLAPRRSDRRICRAYKVSKRRQADEAIVMGCFAVELSGDRRIQAARLVYGGIAERPAVRARKTESFLEGREWNWESVAAALKILRLEFDLQEDELASADYRAAVLVNLLEKFYRDCIEDASPRSGQEGGRAAAAGPDSALGVRNRDSPPRKGE